MTLVSEKCTICSIPECQGTSLPSPLASLTTHVVSAPASQPPGNQEPPRGIAHSGEAPPLSVSSAAGRQPGTEVVSPLVPFGQEGGEGNT